MEEHSKTFILTKIDRAQNVAVAIDCLGNAIAGGNRQSTISGRIWYNYSNPNPDTIHFWLGMKKVVDSAFLLVDGPDHCMRAYAWEADEFHYDAKPMDQFLLKLFSYPICWGLELVNPVIRWRRSKYVKS